MKGENREDEAAPNTAPDEKPKGKVSWWQATQSPSMMAQKRVHGRVSVMGG
jgi:hypothetical protein